MIGIAGPRAALFAMAIVLVAEDRAFASLRPAAVENVARDNDRC